MEEKPYESSYDAARNTLLVAGSVDELAGPVFREDLATHSEDHTKPLVVDLSEVEFFPSLAVGVLAVAMRKSREAGSEIEVQARAGGIVARVLTICALPYTELSTEADPA